MPLNSVSTFFDCHRNETSCSFDCRPPRKCFQVMECDEQKGSFFVCADGNPNFLWMVSTALVILISCILLLCCAGVVYGSIIGITRYLKNRREPRGYSTKSNPKISGATTYTLNPNPSIKHFDSARKTTM